MTAKRKIHAFEFDKEHHHVALVDKAANLSTVMVMKADKEITVSLDMKEFLEKFYNMWDKDAAELAGILGYSDGKVKINTASGDKGLALDYAGVYDNFPKYVNEDGSNPMMYKSATEFLAGEFASLDLLKGTDLPDTLPYSLTQRVLAVEKAFNDLSKTSTDSSKEDNLNIATGESMSDLTKEEIAKQAKDNKALLAEVESLKASQTAELETMKSLIADMKADKLATAKAAKVELVKGYTFIKDDAQAGVVDALLGMADSTELEKALEGARVALEAAINLDGEAGADGADAGTAKTDVQKTMDYTTELLKSRKKNKGAS